MDTARPIRHAQRREPPALAGSGGGLDRPGLIGAACAASPAPGATPARTFAHAGEMVTALEAGGIACHTPLGFPVYAADAAALICALEPDGVAAYNVSVWSDASLPREIENALGREGSVLTGANWIARDLIPTDAVALSDLQGVLGGTVVTEPPP